MSFQIELSEPSSTALSYSISTSDITAQSNSGSSADEFPDYQSLASTVYFPAGSTRQYVSIQVAALDGSSSDYVPEKTFSVRVNDSLTNSLITTATGHLVSFLGLNSRYSIGMSNDQVSDEGPGQVAQITIGASTYLSVPLPPPITVNLAFGLGSATTSGALNDFSGSVPASVTLSQSNNYTATISLPIQDDNRDEPDETARVIITNVSSINNSGNYYVFDAESLINIRDNDLPTVSITTNPTATGTTAEGAFAGTKNARFQVALSNLPVDGNPVSVQYSVRGTSANSADLSDFISTGATSELPSGIITFLPGNPLTQDLLIGIQGDNDIELDEAFEVVLTPLSLNATVGVSTANGTIFNDDTNITIGSKTVTEGATGTTNTVPVSISWAPSLTIPVSLELTSANGTANAGLDYLGVNAASVTLPATVTSAAFNVTIIGDNLVETSPETFLLRGKSDSDTSISDATISITDDDVPPSPILSISPPSVSMPESHTGTTSSFTFTVTRSGSTSGASSAKWAVTGSGSVPANTTDFGSTTFPSGTVSFSDGQSTQTVTVNVLGDTVVESDENFTVTLSSPSNATLGTQTASGTIINDDTIISIVPASATNVEGDSGVTAFTFTVMRTPNIAASSTLNYAVSGEGASPADAADFGGAFPTGPLTVSGGSQTVTILVSGDTLIEPNQSFKVTLSNPSLGTNLSATNSFGVGTINDDDTPVFSITAIDANKAEGHSGTTAFTFTASRTGDVTNGTSIDFDVIGNTSNPANASDFVSALLPTGTINFDALASSATVTIDVIGDTTVEQNEGFLISLKNQPTGTLISTTAGSANGVIQNDDSQFSISGPSPTYEGNGTSGTTSFAFTISRTGDTTKSVPLTYTISSPVSGSTLAPASIPDDLDGGTTPLTSTGAGPITIYIPVKHDYTEEPDEDFQVTLGLGTGATNATIGTSKAVGVILNDDTPPTVTIDDPVGVLEGNPGGTTPSITFTVTVSGTVNLPFQLLASTSDQTATAGSDYTAITSFPLSISAPGTYPIPISLIPDLWKEPNERFDVNLTLASGSGPIASGSDLQGTGVIKNDDAPPVITISPPTNLFEGHTGAGNSAKFAVSISPPVPSGWPFSYTANYSTVDGTAISSGGTPSDPKDFTATSSPVSVVFNSSNPSTQYISISLDGDTVVESDQSFSMQLTSISSSATAGTTSATALIQNDDATVSISGPISSKEGHSGDTLFTYNVNRSGYLGKTAKISYQIPVVGSAASTTTPSATVPDDFSSTSGTVSIPSGATSSSFSIQVKGDYDVEPDERFDLSLSLLPGIDGDNLSITTGTSYGIIQNDDVPPSVSLTPQSTSDIEVWERAPSTFIDYKKSRWILSRTGGNPSLPITVNLNTTGDAMFNGAGTDYTLRYWNSAALSSTAVAISNLSNPFSVIIPGSASSVTIELEAVADGGAFNAESDETATINIVPNPGNYLISGSSSSSVTIHDSVYVNLRATKKYAYEKLQSSELAYETRLGEYTVTLSDPVPFAMPIKLWITGSATRSDLVSPDYTLASDAPVTLALNGGPITQGRILTFPAFSTTTKIHLAPTADDVLEPTEDAEISVVDNASTQDVYLRGSSFFDEVLIRDLSPTAYIAKDDVVKANVPMTSEKCSCACECPPTNRPEPISLSASLSDIGLYNALTLVAEFTTAREPIGPSLDALLAITGLSTGTAVLSVPPSLPPELSVGNRIQQVNVNAYDELGRNVWSKDLYFNINSLANDVRGRVGFTADLSHLGSGNYQFEISTVTHFGDGNAGPVETIYIEDNFDFADEPDPSTVLRPDDFLGKGWEIEGIPMIKVVPPGSSSFSHARPGLWYAPGNGGAFWFKYEGGAYNAPLGLSMTVSGPDASNNYTLTDQFGTELRFKTQSSGIIGNPTRLGFLEQSTDRNKRVTTYAYDPASRQLVSITDSFGRTMNFLTGTVTGPGLDETTDFTGGKFSYKYDSENRLVEYSTADPDGDGPQTPIVTTFTYDSLGLSTDTDRLKSEIITENGITLHKIEYVYDSLGHLSQRLEFEDGSLTPTHTWDYDPIASSSFVVDVRDSASNVATLSNPALAIIPADLDLVNVVTSPDGAKYRTDINWIKQVVTEGHLDNTGNFDNQTRYEYNAQRDLVKIIYPEVTVPGLPNQTLLETFVYDIDHNVTSRTVSSSDYAADRVESWTYGVNSQPKSYTDRLNRTTTYTLDDYGNATIITEPSVSNPNDPGTLSKITYITYFTKQRDATSPDPNVNKSRWGMTEITTMPDPDGPGTLLAPAYKYTYDNFGNVTNLLWPNGNNESSVFDSAGLKMTSSKLGAASYVTVNGVATTTDFNTTYLYADPSAANVTSIYNLPRYVIESPNTSDERQTKLEYNGWGQVARITRQNPTVSGVSSTDITTFRYDGHGRLKTMTTPPVDIVNPDGTTAANTQLTTTYKYDFSDRVVEIIDPYQQSTTFSYNDDGLLESQTMPDPDGGGPLHATVSEYRYDERDRLTEYFVVDPEDPSRYLIHQRFAYDPEGRLTRTTDLVRNDQPSSTNEYDAAGRLIFATDARNSKTEYTYATNTDNLEKVTQPDPVSGQPVGAGAPAWSMKYDALDRPVSSTNPLLKTTSYVYDVMSQLTKVTYPAANSTSAPPGVEYNYTLGGALKSVVQIGELGTSDNPNNRRTTEYRYNRNQELLDVFYFGSNDPQGSNYYSEGFVRDRLGRVKSARDGRGQLVHYEYNDLDWVKTVTSPDPDLTTTANGPLTPIVQSYGYDARGLVRTVSYPGPTGNGLKSTRRYDNAGRMIELLSPLVGRNTQSSNDFLSQKVEYDGIGRQTKVRDGADAVTEYQYHDDVGEYWILQPDNDLDASNGVPTTVISFDAVGNRTDLRDPVGNDHPMVYDYLNRMTSEADELGRLRSYTYDLNGNRQSMTDRNGRVRKFNYDALDRPTTEDWIDPADATQAAIQHQISYDYERFGELGAVWERDFGTGSAKKLEYDFSYDTWGQLTTVIDQADIAADRAVLAPSSGTKTVTWTLAWDPLKRGDLNQIASTIASAAGTRMGLTNSYQYDNLGRATSITQSASGTTGSTVSNVPSKLKQVSLSYKQGGQLDKIIRRQDATADTPANEVATSEYTYFANGGLASITHTNRISTTASSPLAAYSWTYDADNRIGSFTAPEGRFDYSYDKQDQLLASLFTDLGLADPSVKSENFAGYNTANGTYSGYDANGNPNDLGEVLDAENQLTDSGQDPDLIDDGDSNRYVMIYDNEGNLIRKTERIFNTNGVLVDGKSERYAYDHRNRMIEAKFYASAAAAAINQHNKIITYSYDAFDRRVKKYTVTFPGGAVTTQRFVWLLDQPQLILNSNGDVKNRYLNGPAVDQVFSDESSSGLLWLLGDNQNTIRDVVQRQANTTDTTDVINHRTYSAFGRITSEMKPASGAAAGTSSTTLTATSSNTDIAYTGRDLDRDTNFQYHRARWYSPILRRFTQKDPIVWGGGDTNLFRYGANSPTNATDPSGHAPKHNQNDAAAKQRLLEAMAKVSQIEGILAIPELREIYGDAVVNDLQNRLEIARERLIEIGDRLAMKDTFEDKCIDALAGEDRNRAMASGLSEAAKEFAKEAAIQGAIAAGSYVGGPIVGSALDKSLDLAAGYLKRLRSLRKLKCLGKELIKDETGSVGRGVGPNRFASSGTTLRPEKIYTGSKKHGVNWTEGPATAKSLNTPQGQWSQADLDFASQQGASLKPREGGWFKLPDGATSKIHMPDGTTVDATHVWIRNNGTGTFHGYPGIKPPNEVTIN